MTQGTGPVKSMLLLSVTVLLFVLVSLRSGLEASHFQPVTKTGSINCLPKSNILGQIVVYILAPLRIQGQRYIIVKDSLPFGTDIFPPHNKREYGRQFQLTMEPQNLTLSLLLRTGI